MANNGTMNAVNAVSGALASAYITIGGTRYKMIQFTAFSSNMEIKTAEVAILGRTGKGNKPGGWKGTWKGTAHYNQSVLRQMWQDYKRTGVLPTMDIQITNEDEGAGVGRQTIILRGCLSKGGTLAKFDADSSALDEDLEGTFDDWEMPEKFSLLAAMRA